MWCSTTSSRPLDGGASHFEGGRFPGHRWRLGIRSTKLDLRLSRRLPSGQRPRGRMRTRSPIPGQRSSGTGSGPLSMSRARNCPTLPESRRTSTPQSQWATTVPSWAGPDPSGGGDYEVVSTNLGPHAGLLVASALLSDYVLTVRRTSSSGAP